MSMLGIHNHSINAKGRMNFPAKLLDELGNKFVLTVGLDGCIFVYSIESWEKLSEKIQSYPIAQSRQLARLLFGNACEVEPDAQGRIIIPKNLRDYAGLSQAVIVIGSSTHAEIWDAERWNKQMDIDVQQTLTDCITDMQF